MGSVPNGVNRFWPLIDKKSKNVVPEEMPPLVDQPPIESAVVQARTTGIDGFIGVGMPSWDEHMHGHILHRCDVQGERDEAIAPNSLPMAQSLLNGG